MVNNRMAFVTTWLGTAALLFAAGSADYGGSKMETAVEVLTLASAVGTVAMTIFAFARSGRPVRQTAPLLFLGLLALPSL
jgi:hypothetical protein